MKKIIFAFLICISFLRIPNVNAKQTNLIMEETTNLYYAMYNQDFYRSFPFFRYFQDGKRVYCIDPDQKVTTNLYEEVDQISYLKEEIMEKIKLIGYFGTDYPGHNTQNYELATQALIWEEIKGVTVRWFTERYSYGTEIDVTKERDEIQRLIREYQTKPLLSSSFAKGSIQDKIRISDSNHILNQYEVLSFEGGQAYIENDELKITLGNQVGDYKIILKRKKYDNDSTTYYIAHQSQTMMRARMNEEYLEVPVTIESGKITIQKKGIRLDGTKENLSNVQFELRTRENFYYQDGSLRYGKDELLGTYKTGEEGKMTLELPYGEYYLLETETQKGYELSTDSYPFEVTKEEETLEILNNPLYGSLKLIKKDKDTLETLAGVKFLITNLETKKEYTVVTNSDGSAFLEFLPLGTYEIKELETLPNYLLEEESKIIELKEQKEQIEYTFYNEKIPEIPDTDAYDLKIVWEFLGCMCLFYGIKKK